MRHLSRRDFLASTAVGIGTAAGWQSRRALWAAEEDGSGMKFGLVTYLWGQDWDLPTLIANCERAEVFGVELRTEHAHRVEPSLSLRERQQVRQRFEDTPVVCLGLGTNQKFDDPDPEKLRAMIEGTQEFIKLSHDIGGSGVKVKPDSFHEDVPHEQTIDQIGRSLDELGRFAADYRQQIRLEVHGQCADLPTIASIMQIADHPNVAVCWNSNQEDLDGQGLQHNFRLVRDRFGDTLHLQELDGDEYPYQQLIHLLVESDYQGWALLEARGNPADRVAALRQQRKLFEQMLASAKL